jgi:hypothetical protein
MSIQFGDNLKHNNPLFPIVDVEDVKGGIRTITTFSDTDLYNAFNDIPDKLKQNYTSLIVTSTSQHYYLTGIDATLTTSWTLTGSGLSASGTTNSIAKWTGSTSLGDSLITDNGDTVTINGNLNVIGTSSTITSENLLVKDPIILLAGSQSTPLFDAGLFVNRGTGDTQALIWDESSSEFSFFSTTSSSTTMGNVSIGTYSNVRTGPLSVGTGITSSSRFLVSSSGGTLSLVVNEQGDTIFSGNTKISGVTFSSLPPGSITFGGKTAIYSPGDRQIVIGTDNLSGYNYNYGWKFTDYQITNLWGNPIEVQNTIGTIGNLWIGSNLNFAGYGGASQQSTLFVKGTTSSIMKVVGTGATWSNSASIFLVENSGKVSIGPTFSSPFNARLDVNTSSFTFGVHTNGDYVTSKGGGRYAFLDGSTGMWGGGTGNIIFKAYSTGDAFKFEPQYTTSNFNGVGLGNNIQRIILQEYTIAASFSNNQIRMIELKPTINKTGTASGIDRGLYINPTLTNDITKFRSIEVTNGEVMFNTLGGYVNIGSTQSISGAKLFIQSSTSSTTIGSNVMLDLYNGDNGIFDSISEIAFSQNGQPGASQPYNVGHRYALITGYAITGNNSVSTGGIKFSTRALTGASLVTSLVVDQNGGVYNQSRGISNTIYGYQALLTATASLNNTAFGYQALYSNTANENVAFGYQSLRFNTTGNVNTALGNYSLYFNTIGNRNTAVGLTTLYRNSSGNDNTAFGYQSLYSNTIGIANTAIGSLSLHNNTTTISALNITNGGSGYTASSTFSSIQLSYISGSVASTYPIVTIYVGIGGTVSNVILETYGTGFIDTTTVMGANLGTGVTFSVSVSTLSSGNNNTVIGYQSMYSNTSGNNNTVIGYQSMYSNTSGIQNTSIGSNSLFSNTTGNDNVSIGYGSLYFNTSGYSNTSVGSLTLQSNTSGYHNVAIGYASLQLNSTGRNNTSIGSFTSQLNTTGSWNTTLGYVSSGNNKTGNSNVTIGYGALYSATQSSFNTAVGNATLWVSQGSYNTTLGYNSLGQIITGNYNIGIGVNAGTLMSGTTSSATQSDNSIFIGYDTRPQTSLQTNQIVIGHGATGSGSNSVTLGASTITKTQLRGTINIGNVPQYASNGAAISGGLVPGDIYQTLSNVLMVVI